VTTTQVVVAVVCILIAAGDVAAITLVLRRALGSLAAKQKIERRLFLNVFRRSFNTRHYLLHEHLGLLNEYTDVLAEQALAFLVASGLTIERRLINNITKLNRVLEPFFVTLTKNPLPDELKPEYLNVTSPDFDPEDQIAASREKIQNAIEQAGKLKIRDDDPSHAELEEAAQKADSALRLAMLLLPVLSAILLAAVVIPTVLLAG